MKQLSFTDEHGSFTMENPEDTSYLYFPLASESGLKSSVTPNLGGDSKTNQDSFLLEPVSSENLHNNRSCRHNHHKRFCLRMNYEYHHTGNPHRNDRRTQILCQKQDTSRRDKSP